MHNPSIMQRAARIKLLVLDVDGVLTDGRVVYDDQGREIKFFDVRDGHGLKLLQRGGVEVAWLSGRGSEANRVRAKELGVERLIEKCLVKLPALRELMASCQVMPEQVAYMGDDLIDLPAMAAVGLALAPADAQPQARAVAHWVCRAPGGRGAVREACELILRANGAWKEVTERYL
ncbi:MAG: HAD hydrolase family protein [Desulfarculus sp.]|nr:HAD hydrolase family protein [Desulfarculus sp.]